MYNDLLFKVLKFFLFYGSNKFQSLHDIIALIFSLWGCEQHLATYAWKVTNTSWEADHAAES